MLLTQLSVKDREVAYMIYYIIAVKLYSVYSLYILDKGQFSIHYLVCTRIMHIDLIATGVLQHTIKFSKIHSICYGMVVQAIAHPNNVCSRCSMAHLKVLFNAKGAM